jgi:hypothetical protein
MLISFNSPNWERKSFVGSGEAAEWHPVFELHPSGRSTRIGLTRDGGWVVEISDAKVMPEGFNTTLLLLLEMNRTEALATVRRGIAAEGLPDPVIRTFPFDMIVTAALTFSQYWRNLAISWLEEGYPLNDEMASNLEGLPLVHRWRRERGDKIFDA